MDSKLQDAFDVLTTQAKDLFLDRTIHELHSIPTSLEFTRDYVAKNKPVIIRGAIRKWDACKKWNSEYFRSFYGDKVMTVAVTPNGYADGIATKMPENIEYFVLPEEQKMSMSHFLGKLDDHSDQICYIQRQNSNLIEDLPGLLTDLNLNDLKFAEEAFNKQPDAVNFWMGDERAITSMHKDPYENIYCVVAGHKDFILVPPTDYHLVARQNYPIATYKTTDDEMIIDPMLDKKGEQSQVEWVSVDPLKPNFDMYPEYREATPYRLRINAGDMLYLPSMWYHHVQQSHKCIATNFWYDMDYDARYCYYKFVEALCGHGHAF